MTQELFFKDGLLFSCTRCSTCCRYESGYVFLTEKDVDNLAVSLQMRYTDFIEIFCHWINIGGGKEQLSLKEKSNYDCIFWKEKCIVYEVRPLQCRTFPFWDSILSSEESWKRAASSCPGIGKGQWHNYEEIQQLRLKQRSTPIIWRQRK